MIYRRDKIILNIFSIALLGAFFLFSIFGWYLWGESIVAEESRLQELSTRLGVQTDQAMINARDLLTDLNDSGFNPCSEPHIKQMHDSALVHPYIRGIGFWQAAERLCGAGFVQKITPSRASRIYDSGVIAWWPGKETEVSGVELFLMRFGHHDVAIDPRLLLGADLVDNQKAGLWVDGLLMVTTPAHSVLPAPESLKQGLTLDSENQLITSRFSQNTIFPIDVVAQQPMSAFWQRYLPTVLTVGLIGLLLMALWIFAVYKYSKKQLSITAELKAAIEHGQIVAHYQPIIDLASGRCLGAESLARWTRGNGEIVGPDVFVAIAEEANMATGLTIAMLERVLSDMSEFLKEFPDFSFNVNLCAQDLADDHFLDYLQEALRAANVDASAIKLEITERALFDSDVSRQRISILRQRGHKIAIDDFGTGYSSLAYLESFELDVLKIDKSFVDAIETFAVTSNVINHVIQMAISLQLNIVAEGVESEHQANWLVQQNVLHGQGYFFSRPLTKEGFIEFHRKNNNGQQTTNNVFDIAGQSSPRQERAI